MKTKSLPGTTPRSSKGEATRRKILEAAVDLVYRKGFNATSVDDVLAASSTGKSQFYHYFGSKEQLVRDIIAFHLDSMPAVQKPLLDNLGSLAGIDTWLGQIEKDYLQGLYQLGCPIGNLASELASQSEDLRQSLESTFSAWEDALAHGLRQMKARGELRSDASPESLAVFAVSAIEGALLLAKTHKGQRPLKSTLEQVRAHLCNCALGAGTDLPARMPSMLLNADIKDLAQPSRIQGATKEATRPQTNPKAGTSRPMAPKKQLRTFFCP